MFRIAQIIFKSCFNIIDRSLLEKAVLNIWDIAVTLDLYQVPNWQILKIICYCEFLSLYYWILFLRYLQQIPFFC